MKRTQIKLCGFRTPEDIEKIKGLPIDAIGMILAPDRKRTVTIKQAKELISLLPKNVMTVGVFVNPSVEQLEQTLRQVPFQAIQLHGEEPPAFCQLVKQTWSVKVIKTFHVYGTQIEFNELLEDYAPWIDVVLLDSSHQGMKGGTGKSFCWEVIPAFQKRCQLFDLPVWIAGGIRPDNVGTLVQAVQPDGIDVSSGIEKDGKKEERLIRQLVERVYQSE